MKTKKIIAALFVVSLVTFSACKKKTDDSSSTNTPTPTVNKLCDGNGSSTYYPLDSTDSWGYSFTISGMNQSISPLLKVTGTTIYNSKKYAFIEDQNSYFSDTYLRKDAVTNSIYRYNDNNATEYLEIPGTPTLNQSWSIENSYTRKVTNLSASINTSSCSYSGLLEISEYDNTSALSKKLYYKKGLGMVYSAGSGSFPSVFSLKSTSLK